MKFNQRLRQDLEKYSNYVILVEGKKDITALKSLGFVKVYAIHHTGVPLREGIEQIAQHINKKEKVCILTDFDKRGKQLYMQVKAILQDLGIIIDSSLRGLLLKAGISHIEGMSKFMNRIENI